MTKLIHQIYYAIGINMSVAHINTCKKLLKRPTNVDSPVYKKLWTADTIKNGAEQIN